MKLFDYDLDGAYKEGQDRPSSYRAISKLGWEPYSFGGEDSGRMDYNEHFARLGGRGYPRAASPPEMMQFLSSYINTINDLGQGSYLNDAEIKVAEDILGHPPEFLSYGIQSDDENFMIFQFINEIVFSEGKYEIKDCCGGLQYSVKDFERGVLIELKDIAALRPRLVYHLTGSWYDGLPDEISANTCLRLPDDDTSHPLGFNRVDDKYIIEPVDMAFSRGVGKHEWED